LGKGFEPDDQVKATKAPGRTGAQSPSAHGRQSASALWWTAAVKISCS